MVDYCVIFLGGVSLRSNYRPLLYFSSHGGSVPAALEPAVGGRNYAVTTRNYFYCDNPLLLWLCIEGKYSAVAGLVHAFGSWQRCV